MSEFRKIVVPFDFSDHSGAALDVASDLAKRLDSELHLVHVIQPPTYAYGYGAYTGDVAPAAFDMLEVRNIAEKALNEAIGAMSTPPASVEAHLIEGHRIDGEILGAAEKLGAELIVMGTHGRTGLAHAFLGSVAERTLRRAPCPVLTVQARE